MELQPDNSIIGERWACLLCDKRVGKPQIYSSQSTSSSRTHLAIHHKLYPPVKEDLLQQADDAEQPVEDPEPAIPSTDPSPLPDNPTVLDLQQASSRKRPASSQPLNVHSSSRPWFAIP
jgi:hypothetical protein